MQKATCASPTGRQLAPFNGRLPHTADASFLSFLGAVSREGCGVCTPEKGWGRSGTHLSHTARVAALPQGSSHPWDLPEFPTSAPQNQAVLGSGLVPHCTSIFACHFAIKFQVNLKEKIAVHVGWVDL